MSLQEAGGGTPEAASRAAAPGDGALLTSFDMHRALVADVRACPGAYVTNCHLMPADLRAAIEAGQMRLHQDDPSCAVVLWDKGTHDQVFIHWADTGPDAEGGTGEEAPLPAALRFQRPSVIENPFAAATVEAPAEGAPARLAQLARAWGFETIRTSRRLERALDAFDPLAHSPEAAGCRVGPAGPEDAGAVARMLAQGFDPRCDFIPDSDELAQALAQQRILCAWPDEAPQGQGEPAALLHFEEGAVTMLRHLFVSEALRGRGVARALLAAYLVQARTRQAHRAILWVRDDNAPALALYASFGYRFEGRRSEEYFKEGALGEDHVKEGS